MDDLETRLRAEGTAFRADHQRAVQPRERRRRSWTTPLVAGLATAAVVVGVALVLPDRHDRPLPAVAASEVALDVPEVDGLALGKDWLALTGSSQPGEDDILQVRRRSDLAVVTTLRTTFAHGGPTCPHLEGDQLFWTDNEVIPSDLVPGPVGGWSLWQRDLRTGRQVKLGAGSGQGGAGYGFAPCAVGEDGVVAWQPDDKHVTVLTLATGRRTTTDGSGLIGVADGEAVTTKNVTMCVDCSSTAFPEGLAVERAGREVARVDGGVSVYADSGHVIAFAQKKGAETADGQLVSLCSLPACSDLHRIADDPASGNAVLGSTFVVWSSLRESPTLYRFDGGKAPALAPGYVGFRAVAASGDELAYVVRPGYNELGSSAPAVLHVTPVTGRR